jgi:hypothetical protein
MSLIDKKRSGAGLHLGTRKGILAYMVMKIRQNGHNGDEDTEL